MRKLLLRTLQRIFQRETLGKTRFKESENTILLMFSLVHKLKIFWKKGTYEKADEKESA